MEAIEGLLVITLMLFVLFYIWAFGFLMYQNWAVQYVATDTASRIAQTYGYSSSDPITGYISHATRVSLSPYRYKDDEEEKKALDCFHAVLLLPEGAFFPPLFHGIPPAAQLRSTRQRIIC